MNYIYKIYNDINSKLYIGQTTKTLEERFKGHIYEALNKKNDNKPLHSAIKKYGPEHFFIELVEEAPEDQSLDEREQYWIAYYDSYGQPNGYNATIGGNLFSKDTNPMNLPEIREKVSESQKINTYWKSEEWKNKQRERWSGEDNPAKKEENRKKTSDRVKGAGNPACNPEVKEKIRQKAIGRKASDETRKKMSENNGRYWATHQVPKKVINAAAKGRAKPIAAVDINTNEIIKEFDFTKDAIIWLFGTFNAKERIHMNEYCKLCSYLDKDKELYGYKWIRLPKCND